MPDDITVLLRAASSGDPSAASKLLPAVYDSLREIARTKMARESPGQTLQPTALVHEAYLRVARDLDAHWENRRHFFGAAAEAMRRILIERARRLRRVRHGGGLERVEFDESAVIASPPSEELLLLEDALVRLEKRDPRKADIVKLRYFVGLTIEETAETLGLSPATVKVDWSYARAWLHREMDRSGDGGALGHGV